MNYLAALCGAIAVLAVPASASANSGSITNIAPAGNGQFTATFTTTSTTCPTVYYCGWFPTATQAGVNDPCDPYSHKLVYVGTLQDDLGTHGPMTETFYVDPAFGDSFKLCLHISRGTSNPRVNVGEAIYSPTTQAPAPQNPAAAPTTPAPTPTDEGVAYVAMTLSEAKTLVPDALRQDYGQRFARSTLTRSCSRLSSRKVRCRVAWRKSPYKFRGTVTLWYGDDDASDDYSTYTYTTSVKRTRTSKRASGGGNSGGSTPRAQPSCNPNYSGVCLQNGGDLNCGDISATDFRSVGSDPFRLDGDGDGVACES